MPKAEAIEADAAATAMEEAAAIEAVVAEQALGTQTTTTGSANVNWAEIHKGGGRARAGPASWERWTTQLRCNATHPRALLLSALEEATQADKDRERDYRAESLAAHDRWQTDALACWSEGEESDGGREAWKMWTVEQRQTFASESVAGVSAHSFVVGMALVSLVARDQRNTQF